MTQMSLIILVLVGLVLSSTLASFNPHEGPLLSAVTSFTLATATSTLTKPTTCYVTTGQVTECRRKRGMEEKPIQSKDDLLIAPSAVVGIEATPLPRVTRSLDIFNAAVSSSMMDDSFRQYQNVLPLFRHFAKSVGRNNVVSVGNCGMSTVNFSEFLSCLGMTVQETTTLTATFTETSTLSAGYATMTVAGCTPAGFPYLYCSKTASASTSLISIGGIEISPI